jgi:antitoxin component YwqK of YwqJK toxin-antitoxin module
VASAQDAIQQHRIVNIKNDTAIIKAEVWMPEYKVKKKYPYAFYTWYYKQDIHQTQGDYSGQVLDGSYHHYNLNGQLLIKGYYEKGLKSGEWNYWSVNGYLLIKMHYKDGLLEGDYWLYNGKGSLVEHRNYKKGVLNGKVYRFKNGELSSTSFYKNGNLKKVVYYENGKQLNIEKYDPEGNKIVIPKAEKKIRKEASPEEDEIPKNSIWKRILPWFQKNENNQ